MSSALSTYSFENWVSNGGRLWLNMFDAASVGGSLSFGPSACSVTFAFSSIPAGQVAWGQGRHPILNGADENTIFYGPLRGNFASGVIGGPFGES